MSTSKVRLPQHCCLPGDVDAVVEAQWRSLGEARKQGASHRRDTLPSRSRDRLRQSVISKLHLSLFESPVTSMTL